MTRLIRDMSFVDVRYDPESSKSLRKDIAEKLKELEKKRKGIQNGR